MYLNIVESLDHYGLKNPAQAKTENSDFLFFTARMLEELAFGKNKGMVRLGLKCEPKIKCPKFEMEL